MNGAATTPGATRTGGDTALAVVLILVAAITALYWVLWYLVPGGERMLSVLPDDPAHARFENAFVVADAWMALACLMAARRLLADPAGAGGWLYMAGSAGFYLAGMDILYDLQNGIYAMLADDAHFSAVLTEIAINAGTVAFSAIAIARARAAP